MRRLRIDNNAVDRWLIELQSEKNGGPDSFTRDYGNQKIIDMCYVT